MTIAQDVSWALHEAEQRILQSIQGMDSSGWEPVFDEDGNPNVPDDERAVFVFLLGDRPIHAERPGDDAGWGLREGYWDIEKQYWRVSGSPNPYVTHWREQPPPPESAK